MNKTRILNDRPISRASNVLQGMLCLVGCGLACSAWLPVPSAAADVKPARVRQGTIDPHAQIRVVDEQGRDVPAFDVMVRTAERGRSEWVHGSKGKATLRFPDGFRDVESLELVVRSPAEYASAAERFSGAAREKLLAGKATIVLRRGELVQLGFRLPSGMSWPAGVKPEVYFDDDRDFVRMMWQPINRRHGFTDPNPLGVRGGGPGPFQFRLSSQSPPFDVAIPGPGFLQYFNRGPFTHADVKQGELEIELERPAALNVHFDAGGSKPEMLPFDRSTVDVYRTFLKNPSTIYQVAYQIGSPIPRDLRVTDLAAGGYVVVIRTEAKPKGRPTRAFDRFTIDPGEFQDVKNVTLAAGQTKSVVLQYVPFDAHAFRGHRTAVVRITRPDGKPPAGREVTIGYFDGHYGNYRVFSGKAPPSGEIILTDITAEKPEFVSRDPYFVQLGSETLGRFGFQTKKDTETFTFIVPPVAGDEAPDIDLVNVTTGKHARLSDFRGRTVCLDFWATWCRPCQEPMRRLDKLMAEKGQQLKDRVVILPLSIDAQPELVTHHITERGWTHLGHYWAGEKPKPGWDSGPVRAFVLSGVPTTILIGRDGRIVWRGDPLDRVAGKDLETRLEEAAKE